MSWLERLGEPLAKTRQEAEAYISAELERAVPRGWTVGRLPSIRLTFDADPLESKGWGFVVHC